MESAKDIFREHLRNNGLLYSKQREEILDIFLKTEKHPTINDLYYLVRKKHPQIGADIIRPIQVLHRIIPLIFYHHERWNGKGYPSGLKGDEIPIGSRIIAIADAYQALISNRPYRKKAYLKDMAIKIIKKGSGIQFDPAIVRVFLKILDKEK